jgi:hypothetical protein
MPPAPSVNRNTAVNDAPHNAICSGMVSTSSLGADILPSWHSNCQSTIGEKKKKELFRKMYYMAIKVDALKAKSLKTEWEKVFGALVGKKKKEVED